MAKQPSDFWTKTTREMLGSVKEIGAMPFILFEYYRTWETAPDGIRPSLQTVADDLGITKSAVCNHKKVLLEKSWISEEKGRIFIEKSFRKTESHSEKLNANEESHSEILNVHSENLNEDSEKLNGTELVLKGISLGRTIERTEEDKSITDVMPKKPSRKRSKPLTEFPEDFTVTEAMKRWAKAKGYDSDLETETEAFIDNHISKGNKFSDWARAWQTWVRNSHTKFKSKSAPKPIQAKPKDDFYENTEGSRIDFATAVDLFFELHNKHGGDQVTTELYGLMKKQWLDLKENKGFETEIENYELKHDIGQRISTPGQGTAPKPNYERWRQNGNGQKPQMSVS